MARKVAWIALPLVLLASPAAGAARRGYIDRSGKLAIEARFDEAAPGLWTGAGDFSCGRALVRLDTGYCYIDRLGRVAIPATAGISTEYPGFSEGLAACRAGFMAHLG